ncbi:hypothetical protein LSH36_279g01056 [Paralvinella palmiformis]|uniref:UV-stimulated scaffold protein A C-terminal domain-containing protein n=1 Tax=Paralvinella palmiformis TaxID=53620 RepID=A0AAD9N272_9ANNE|nr:hypothetical protein LSH36_279g01056 [Paralvinella palmiformis]
MAQKLMDVEQCHELDKLIEALTTSGRPELDQVELKRLKNICKQSDDYVKKCYHAAMIQLTKEHSEIRLSAVQLMDVLFNRSHCFRELLLADFKDFMELTIEINADYPLPPPKLVAKTLKSNTIEFVHKWHEKFGDAYKKLALGYNFLKNCKKVNFQDIHARSIAEQQREEERRTRSEAQQREKLEKTLQEIKDMTPEIENALIQAQNCLVLLLPDPDHFDIGGNTSPDRQHEDEHIPNAINSTTECTTTFATEGQTSGANVKCVENNGMNQEGENGSHPSIDNSAHTPEECNSSTHAVNNVLCASTKMGVNLVDSNQTHPVCEETDEFIEPSSGDSEEEEMTASEEDDEEDDGQEGKSDNGGECGEVDMMRDHGICSQEFSLTIDVYPEHVQVEENPDNEDILLNLKDCLCLIDVKYLPAVKNWLEIFAKKGGEQKHIKGVLDLKDSLQKMKEKISRLRIMKSSKPIAEKDKDKIKGDTDSDSGEDFEEVKDYKEGYEPHIPDHLREEYGLTEKPMKPSTNPDWEMPCLSDADDQDPTTAMSTLKKLKRQIEAKNMTTSDPIPSTSRLSNLKKHKLKDVPTVPFGMDLFHWGEKIETPLLVRYDCEHRFWIPNTAEDKVDVNALESMKSRVINFAGRFQPVRWSCRAPLPNGKVCPRMDRHKCPFHGEIIPRDSTGQPTKLKQEVAVPEQEHTETETPEWDDPELQAEIKAATGIDLSRKGKRSKSKGKKKCKQKKYPGLTDIRNELNPVRKRLEKKVLNQNAIRRVADALSAIDEKKRKDKFGNTFHYVHGLRKT